VIWALRLTPELRWQAYWNLAPPSTSHLY
jgi:hypothetical protein